MKRWLTMFAVVSCFAIGCGAPKDQGPASPDQTPQVNEAEVEKAVTSGMPPEMKEKYGK